MRQTLRTLACLAILALLAVSAHAGPDFERWFIVELSGAKAGWMTIAQRTDEGRITSTSELRLDIRRGAASVTLHMMSEFIETTGGEPVSMLATTIMGSQPTTHRWTFHADHVKHEAEQGGRVTTQRLPLPDGKWLPPAAAADFTAQRLKADAKSIVVRTMDPLVGLTPIVITRHIEDRVTIEAMGKEVTALRSKVTQDVAPTAGSTEYLDEDGIPIRTRARIGAMELDMTLATKEQARGIEPAEMPEIMVSTFVKPDRPIPRPRRTTRARYILTIPDGVMPDLPTTGVQRVEQLDESSVRVIVNTRDPRAAEEGDIGNDAYLAATALLDHQDPRVRELRDAAVRGAGEDQHARAEAMRRHVYRHIRDKSLDVGFASASETARSRAGDCTEHAVLLAAMLRADNIPARVVSGIIYAEEFAGQRNIFGYHMWTQALLPKNGEPTWVDLDATLDERPFDAAHIALGVSALADGLAIEALMPVADLMGRVTIRVERAE